jgi:hypothetical protein
MRVPCAAALAAQFPDNPRWEDVLNHVAKRLEWLELGLHMDVFTERTMHADSTAFNAAADRADLLLAVDVRDVAFSTELVCHVENAPSLGNDGRIPNSRDVRVHVSTGYHRV